MSIQIKGKVVKTLPQVSGTGKNGDWVKQEFVIETIEQYPKKICFSVWGDLTEFVNSLEEGREIVVFFNAESREYNSKWYTELRAS